MDNSKTPKVPGVPAGRSVSGTNWKHKQRGSFYRIVGGADVQASTRPLVDGDVVLLYHGTTGYHVRLPDEFFDGRFERVDINLPYTQDFLMSVSIEIEHQIARWGEAHDRSKSAENWFWLIGYLAGKALRCAVTGDKPGALHHTISAAAALAQWHAAIVADTGRGDDADIKPAAPPV